MEKRFKHALIGGSLMGILDGILDGIQTLVPADLPAPWNARLSPYLPSNGELIERAVGAGVGELARRKARGPGVKAVGFGMELWSTLDEVKIIGVRAAYAAGHPGAHQAPASWNWPIGLSYRNASPVSTHSAENLPFQSDMTY